MRIVFCHNYYRIPGGEDRVFEAETQMMRDQGHEVFLYETYSRDIEEKRKIKTAKNVIWNSKVFADLTSMARRLRPDVVHFTNTFPVISPAAYWAFQNEGVPVVQSLHNFRMICPGSLLLREGKFCDKCVRKSIAWPAIVHKCYRGSRVASAVSTLNNSFHKAIRTWDTKIDRYIALSQFSRQQFIKGGIAEDRLVVKPNFVLGPPNLADVKKSDFVVFVGRLSEEKGILALIEAWRRSTRKFRLLVIGSGPLEGLVDQAEAETNGMIENMGQLPHDVVMKIMADAKLAVVPSLSVETFGRAVIEAYSVATPVVAFDIGSIAENVEHEQTGWLVEAGNTLKLAETIDQVLGADKRLAQIGKQARAFFDSHFTVQKNYESTVVIYESLIQSKREPTWFLGRQIPCLENVHCVDSFEFSVKNNAQLYRERTELAQVDPSVGGKWPAKVDIFGLNVSVTNYRSAVDAICRAAKNGESASISCHAAHAVVTFTDRVDWTEQLNRFEMITPDGQPVRWAMNLLHNVGLKDRVYGPELMLRVCEKAAQERLSVFLFGGSPNTLKLLRDNINQRFPDLQIVGTISPPFHELTDLERDAFIVQINSSRASILFVGLGCPKQDLFVSRCRGRLKPVQICVGAAFDFHAGVKRIAPQWMQRNGLEWLFRLLCEPRRLFVRYVVTNTVFVYRLIKQIFKQLLNSVTNRQPEEIENF